MKKTDGLVVLATRVDPKLRKAIRQRSVDLEQPIQRVIQDLLTKGLNRPYQQTEERTESVA